MTVSVEGLRSAADFMRQQTCVDPKWLRDAADEIERLRAALGKIAKDPPATLDEPDLDWEVIQKIRAIARAAISSGVRKSENG